MASSSAMQRAMAHNSHESPLTSLVRRASSRRVQQPPPLQNTPAITFHYDNTPTSHDPSHNNSDFKPPHSPLLHGHFARDSYATASSYENSSLFDSSASGNTSRVQSFNSNAYPDSEIDYRYQYDNDSAYGGVEYSQPDMNSAPALRDSWRSTATTSTVRPGAATIDPRSGQAGDRNTYSWADDFGDEYYGDASSSTSPPKPVALPGISSSPLSAAPTNSHTPPRPHSGYESDGQPRTAGRTPITKPISSNFSRPRPPPPPENTEEQKRQVLQRNLNRQRSQSPGSAFQSTPSSLRNQVSSNSNSWNAVGGQPPPSQARDANAHVQGEGGSTSHSNAVHTSGSTYSTSTSLSSQPPPQPKPPPMANYQSSPHSTSRSSLSPRDALSTHSSSGQHKPSESTQQRPAGAAAPRVESTYSVYSNYSYYSYDTAAPSPTGSAFSNSSDPFNTNLRTKNGSKSNLAVPSPVSSNQPNSRSPLSSSVSVNVNSIPIHPDPTASKAVQEPRSALDFLLLGIEHHEADRLNESARCFERSATEGGGCGVGMLMWGLTLRHGWGCPKNEKQAFKWLQRAAESAVGDLEATRARGIKDTSVVRVSVTPSGGGMIR